MKNKFLAVAVIALSFVAFSCSVDEVAEGPAMNNARMMNSGLNQEIISTPTDSTALSTGDPFAGEPDNIKPPKR